jgi:uncharacterized protein (TIGR02246 family)
MNDTLSSTDYAAIENVIRKLESAWNAADGNAFAVPFAPNADFVTIRAEHFQGRDAIAKGHDAILHTIYAGSKNRFTMESMRLLHPGVALVHVRSLLDAPQGPLAGQHNALFSAVLIRLTGGWQIVSFHNTLAPPPERH